MNVLISGQKWFGAELFRALRAHDEITIVSVCAPVGGEREDRLTGQALLHGVPIIPAGSLRADVVPAGLDLIIAAHSHDFISQKTRNRATFGGIGYHPSLLPLHRGRDAVRWTLKMNEKVTGGTVYRLSNRMDGGNILEQEHVLIRPMDDAEELWRRELGPLGVRLLTQSALTFARHGMQLGREQDEACATWEPAIDRPPAFRPEVFQIPAKCLG